MVAGNDGHACAAMDSAAGAGLNPPLVFVVTAPRTRGMLQRLLPKFLILLALLAAPMAAEAHAILLESTPAANGTPSGPNVGFTLRYNTRIDHARSRLTLTLPDRSTKVLPIADSSAEDQLSTTAELAPGSYSLRWQVLAVDGHITRGDVPFTVTGN
jgi:copper resistance protein C